MKRIWMMSVCALVSALAQTSIAATDADAKFLAQLEAIQHFCARVSPEANSNRELLAALIAQTPKDQLQDARDSKEYRQVYDAVTAELERADPKQIAQQVCGDTSQKH